MFITFEGIDGCGKTTQAELLVRRLKDESGQSRPVLWTREPGGWDGGSWLRDRLLKDTFLHPMSELLLFLVDRCEHVQREILPVLESGGIVVCERYTDSTLAYQSWGRGIPAERIESMFAWCSFPKPDVTFWLDLPVKAALARVCSRGGRDRFESEENNFLERVRDGFSSLAERFPDRILRAEASEEQHALSAQLFSLLEVSRSR